MLLLYRIFVSGGPCDGLVIPTWYPPFMNFPLALYQELSVWPLECGRSLGTLFPRLVVRGTGHQPCSLFWIITLMDSTGSSDGNESDLQEVQSLGQGDPGEGNG